MSTRWTAADVGDQHGRIAVITGANTGIGYAAGAVLAARGATVVLAGRDPRRCAAATERLAAAVPGATLDTVQLDLAALESVRAAAAELRDRYPRIDLLLNNAGVMMTPQERTADGFERQFGTNHLGHFALTGLLLSSLRDVPGSRIVTVSSSAHRQGRLDLADPNFEQRRYRRTAAYGQSKLANVLFTYELQHRLVEAGASTVAVAVEPGIVGTELKRYAPGPMALTITALTRLIGQPNADQGALATLRAATDPDVRGGEYYGPDGPFQRASGFPVRARSSPRSYDRDLQCRLWTLSTELTGVTYSV
jgi:NAD(P)-dependent dehydrogenase (short-subunit alcohol dehydrogenase family)